MPQGNAFRSSSRAQMGSSAMTTQSQGGGNKKAGFPYIIGRDSWFPIYNNYNNRPLKNLQMNLRPNARPSRPIGSTYSPNTYFHIPGTR
jgi:hypothetical protein